MDLLWPPLYGPAVAALFSFHSYRSGLATALHAAGVDDAMIQLICRWMCPESLHTYRRMGTREHERLIAAASQFNVDTIQSTNVPKISNDLGFAAILDEMVDNNHASSQHERRFDAARRPSPISSATAPVGKPVSLLPVSPDSLAIGDLVVVASETWPSYVCHEHNGAGWSAAIRRLSRSTAIVSFTEARTRDGRPYQDARVPIPSLFKST